MCERCSATVNVRTSVCACGNVFASKTSGPLTRGESKREAINIKRLLESADDTAARKSIRKAKKRALEDEYHLFQRKSSDRACATKRRASQTEDKALHSNRACAAKRRASKTHDEALCRKESNRACAAKKRASETSEEYSQRKQSNRTAMMNKRSKSASIECAISAFHAEIKFGPDFVCSYMLSPHNVQEKCYSV